MKKFALGIVVCNRWQLTQHVLNSLLYTDQSTDSYELFIINNGSDDNISSHLKKLTKSSVLPIKNILSIKNTTISKSWNLFLAISSDYEYRIKLDNDVILQDTTVPQFGTPFKVKVNASTPNEVDPKSGAPRSASITIGAGHRVKQHRQISDKHTRFLDLMEEFHIQKSVDVVSLVPVVPQQTFAYMYNAVNMLRFKKEPYLMGGCMMISRKAFETLGYFDERLPRRIDIEYSQRALKNGLNVGYHPQYGAVHLGHKEPTENPELLERHFQESNRVLDQELPIEVYCDSQWSNVINEIQYQCNKSSLVRLT